MSVKLRCPSCGDKFSVVSLAAVPQFCPLCGYDTAEDEARGEARMAEILESGVAPRYRNTPVQRGVDDTYRAMEAGSEVRAKMVADQLGVGVDETSALKMTNMSDTARYGEDCNTVSMMIGLIRSCSLDRRG